MNRKLTAIALIAAAVLTNAGFIRAQRACSSARSFNSRIDRPGWRCRRCGDGCRACRACSFTSSLGAVEVNPVLQARQRARQGPGGGGGAENRPGPRKPTTIAPTAKPRMIAAVPHLSPRSGHRNARSSERWPGPR